MHLTAKLIYPQIVLFNFSDQYFLSSTFLRAQEFYESSFSNIRNKQFTLEEYIDTEVRENGKFDYFEKWDGFNLNDKIFKKFFHTFKDISIGSKEYKLQLYIKNLIDWNRPFYIIGVCDTQTINHELAHAFYYLSEEYRKQMDKLSVMLLPLKCVLRISKELEDMGYCSEVRYDEIQAYLSTENQFSFIPSEILENYKNTFNQFKMEYERTIE
jgi:hypothetical protein